MSEFERKLKKRKRERGLSYSQAEIRARNYNAMVRHRELSYRVLEISRERFGVGQFYGDERVAIVAS